MKNLIFPLLLLFLIGSETLFSQTVNEIPIREIDVAYIQIVGKSNITRTKVSVEIDFGQENNYFSNKDSRIVDENGKNVIFNSMIDALNFFNKNGYNYVDAYTVTVGSSNVYHYLMKKRD